MFLNLPRNQTLWKTLITARNCWDFHPPSRYKSGLLWFKISKLLHIMQTEDCYLYRWKRVHSCCPITVGWELKSADFKSQNNFIPLIILSRKKRSGRFTRAKNADQRFRKVLRNSEGRRMERTNLKRKHSCTQLRLNYIPAAHSSRCRQGKIIFL